jgi:integrase
MDEAEINKVGTKSGRRKAKPKGQRRRPLGGCIRELKHRPGELFGIFVDPTTRKRRSIKLADSVDAAGWKLAEERLQDAIKKAREIDPSCGQLRVVTLREFVCGDYAGDDPRECRGEFIELVEGRVGASQLQHLKSRLFRAARYFGNAPMSRIGKRECEDYFAKLAKAPGQPRLRTIGEDKKGNAIEESVAAPLAAQTLRHHRNALGSCWVAAIDRNAAATNPWRLVKLKRGGAKPPRFLTREEVQRVLGHVPEKHRAIFTFLSQTGMRLGEALGLTWTRVSADRSRATIEKSKNGKSRTVPMSIGAREVLDRLSETRTLKMNGADFVFRQNERSHLWATWTKACKAAGVGHARIHDLRHHVGSSLAMAGVPLSTIAKILGHGSTMMSEIYSNHQPANAAADAFARLDAQRAATTPAPQQAAGN